LLVKNHSFTLFRHKEMPPARLSGQEARRLLLLGKQAYSSAGAPTGQFSAQAPQEMHFSGSITYCPSPSVMASTGQLAAQAPQDTQASLILYAIIKSSLNGLLDYITVRRGFQYPAR
jgi:hypothetical protein